MEWFVFVPQYAATESSRFDDFQVWRASVRSDSKTLNLMNALKEKGRQSGIPYYYHPYIIKWTVNLTSNPTDIINVKVCMFATQSLKNSKDVWRSSGDSIDFLLKSNETEHFNRTLNAYNISYEVFLNNVQERIDKENETQNARRSEGKKSLWNTFPTPTEISEYLKIVSKANPSVCTLSTIGTTEHKRNIMMLRISNKSKRFHTPILIEGGMHSREWASVPAVLYLIEQIVWNFTKQPAYIQAMDWHIIPLLNPDGYQYSMSTNRLWRKNRRIFSGPCDGVDVNRNFPLGWGLSPSANIICSDEYSGPIALSEAEAIAIKNILESNHFHVYVSVHSYGNSIYIPWLMNGKPTKDNHVQTKIAKSMAAAMSQVDHKTFKYGHVRRGRKSSGMAIDWAYKVHGVVFAFVIETRGSNMGGFLLNHEEILPSSKEVFAGIDKLVQEVNPR